MTEPTAQQLEARLARGLSLDELRELHPDLWEQASDEILTVLAKGKAQPLDEFMRKVRAEADLWSGRLRDSGHNPKSVEAAYPHLVKAQMTFRALEKYYLAAASGQSGGTVRFNLFNGVVIQKLLFAQGLRRKPASMRAFRFWWPLLGQRRFLMPLVQPKGIYCFYSRELVCALAGLIAGRACLEIAAGDGTLARFLGDAGTKVAATDDYSWERNGVAYGDGVERLDAHAALEKHQPAVVLCSWPPPGNRFERQVFATRSVELYVVIGSRHRFASGDWATYKSQKGFDWEEDRALSALVLPPELDPAVLVFRRKAAPSA